MRVWVGEITGAGVTLIHGEHPRAAWLTMRPVRATATERTRAGSNLVVGDGLNDTV